MTTETRKRRNYKEDFKRDAVALVNEQGYKPYEAARSLGIRAQEPDPHAIVANMCVLAPGYFKLS